MAKQKKKSSKKKSSPSSEPVLLGDHQINLPLFLNLEKALARFRELAFKKLSSRHRFNEINQTLLNLINEEPKESFLLSAMIDYISKINDLKILNEPYYFHNFEFWLNQFSRVSDQENYTIRSKIAGKYIPREDYQAFFPIGMNKVFSGSHFVAAHLSPDPDTTIASFWGWVDAFAARVGSGLHIWSLPGGPPESLITKLVCDLFGQMTFAYISRTASTLTLSALDVVSKKNFIKKGIGTSINALEHGVHEKAIILVDEEEYYLGDWRSSDVEAARQIIILFKACLRWFENYLYIKLITLFSKEDLKASHIPGFLSEIFNIAIQDCEPARDFSQQQKQLLHDFFQKVFHVPQGIQGTFGDLNEALKKLKVHEFSHFISEIITLQSSDLFDKKGNLIENRPKIFHYLEKIISHLNTAIYHIRNYVERLDVVIQIKTLVLQNPSPYITMRSDVEDIRLKMKSYDYLTVVITEDNGRLFPVGVVWAADLRKSNLGTVSFRDFCNTEEVKMASYLTTISVIDHHKTSLTTSSAPLALIGDTQSCNVLVAEQALSINERYGSSISDDSNFKDEIEEITKKASAPNLRLLQKKVQRRIASFTKEIAFIHPDREFAEYLCFLHAILDDTDLLTKVSYRDVECVVRLLNRMKSIQLKKDIEIISLDDIPKDKDFARKSAKRILQNSEMYSLYNKTYSLREKEVEENLKLCLEGSASNIFLDTKEQNGCCRVGQTKMFSANFPLFLEKADILRLFWVQRAQEINKERPEIDLHLHMISTIPSAQEVFKDTIGNYSHQDEIWFWTPDTQRAFDHLAVFLSGFQGSPEIIQNHLSVEFLQSNLRETQQIFSRNFGIATIKWREKGRQQIPIAVLQFKAGSINSRKSMITPYLPRLVS